VILSVLVPPEPGISYWLSEMAAILHPLPLVNRLLALKLGRTGDLTVGKSRSVMAASAAMSSVAFLKFRWND
jgi:hypothetical protein